MKDNLNGKQNNKDNKKGIWKILIITFISIIFVISLLLIESSLFLKSKIKTDDQETGYFYGTPSSVEEIKYIDISYNGDRDYVFITDQKITYGGYDEYGNSIYKKFREDAEFIQKIKNYIYKKDLKYLTQFNTAYNANWSLEVSKTGAGCAISGTEEPPEWFNRLLDKLEVYKYKD